MMDKYPVQLEDVHLRDRPIVCQREAMGPTDYMHTFSALRDQCRVAITAARNERNIPNGLGERVKKQCIVLDRFESLEVYRYS
ncbi:hypothetical protein GQ600_7382 [Phytophthora cactorum]|nr:hypothetical protein GQ600_7382 [Phytophthora cactorum]